MKPVVISPKNSAELKFITDLLHKLGIKSHVMTEEEVEDLGLSIMMKEVDRSKKVSRKN